MGPSVSVWSQQEASHGAEGAALWVPMCPYGFLYVPMGPNVSLWVPVCAYGPSRRCPMGRWGRHCGSQCVPMGLSGSLWVPICPYGSQCVCMVPAGGVPWGGGGGAVGPNVSLWSQCVPKCPNVSLWVPMCPYGPNVSLWVPMCPYGSLYVPMGPSVSVWSQQEASHGAVGAALPPALQPYGSPPRGRLRVVGAGRALAGAYQCRVDNGVGPPATALIRLVVTYGPELEEDPPVVPVGDGAEVAELRCRARGVPAVELSWERYGQSLPPDGDWYHWRQWREAPWSGSVLTVTNVSLERSQRRAAPSPNWDQYRNWEPRNRTLGSFVCLLPSASQCLPVPPSAIPVLYQ
eukprot:XP_025002045.1 uncharacterized protein LOC112531323 [Gallus gallus]